MQFVIAFIKPILCYVIWSDSALRVMLCIISSKCPYAQSHQNLAKWDGTLQMSYFTSNMIFAILTLNDLEQPWTNTQAHKTL